MDNPQIIEMLTTMAVVCGVFIMAAIAATIIVAICVIAQKLIDKMSKQNDKKAD